MSSAWDGGRSEGREIREYLCTPLCRWKCVQRHTTEQIRFHVLYSRSVQTADHMHPAVERTEIQAFNESYSWVGEVGCSPSIHRLLEKTPEIRT